MAHDRDEKWARFIAGIAIILITVIVYLPAVKGGFIWDDDDYVTENSNLRNVEGLKKIWLDPISLPQYYPMVFTTFWIEYHIWQTNPIGYHLTNVTLHALCAVLLWIILQYLHLPCAWLTAIIFAIHPVHVESVAWITERKNLLSGLFYLSSLLVYIRFAGLDKSTLYKRQWSLYCLSLGLFICALLSKTVTASLPAVIMLLLWWKRDSILRQEIILLLPFFLIGAIMGIITVWIEINHVGAQGKEWMFSLTDRTLIAGRALWFYFSKIVWPAPLMFIYPRWNIDSNIWWQYLYPLGAITIIAGLFLLYRYRFTGKSPLAAVSIFYVTLSPALGFINIYPFRYSFVADHFQYLASISLIVLFTGILTWYKNRYKVINTIISLLIVCILGILTWRQGYIYQDQETLWRDTLKKNPSAFIAHNNLGIILSEQGKSEEAIAHYMKALQFKSDREKAHNNLGLVLAEQGKVKDAIIHYREALQIKGDYADAHYNLGVILSKQGKMEEAIAHYMKVLKINPDNDIVYNSIGVALAKLGRIKEASAYFSKAVQINPDFTNAQRNLRLAIEKMGNRNRDHKK
ncbi:MAG: tetratricopeptide repeat protein [Nitrospirota bacterium]